MNIRTKTAPSLVGQPSVDFDLNTFEAAIWNKGYDVIVEKAVRCPCKSNNGNVSTCQNCMGSGHLFINPFKTRAIITSINYNTQYKDWGIEKLGTVSVTTMDRDAVTYYDRITLANDYSSFSEVLRVRENDSDGQLFVFTSYKINEIEDVFLYSGDNVPLIRLSPSEYEISTENGYVLLLNYDTSTISNFNNKLAIRYKHNIQYNVIDMPHELRRSYKTNTGGKDEKIILPVNAIARRVHNIEAFAEVANFDGTGTIDNSYL